MKKILEKSHKPELIWPPSWIYKVSERSYGRGHSSNRFSDA